mmetsp:Transcript_6866/g.13978  ORF Transcript_6866/g.13978 Transcript_6866/m.13978 type:complete len:556 (-) Transcript_6866:251-1918(-)
MATYEQQLALALAPKFTSLISMCSSSFIISEVVTDARRKRSSAIQRVLVGMSAVDICASFGWFLSTWAVPRESEFALAAGNQATCNFQGFLLQLAVGAPLYNSSLAIFYLMVIKYNWTNRQLRTIEKWVHTLILSFAIGTSILLLPLKQYNHIGAVCWVIGSPNGCDRSTNTPSDIPCDRGNYAYLYGSVLFYGPIWVCVVLCIICMIFIFSEVRATHRRLDRYGRRIQSLRRSSADTSAVATQAVLYCVSFFFCWMPSTIWSIGHWFGIEQFWLDLLAALCEPLQGFINMLIFVRRRPSSQDKIQRAIAVFLPWMHPDKQEDRSRLSWSGHHMTSSDQPSSSRFVNSRQEHDENTPQECSSQDDLSRECAILEVDDESGSLEEQIFGNLGDEPSQQQHVVADDEAVQQPTGQQAQGERRRSDESMTIHFSTQTASDEGESPIFDVDAPAALPIAAAATAAATLPHENHERIQSDEAYLAEEKKSTNSTKLGEQLHVYFSSSTKIPDDSIEPAQKQTGAPSRDGIETNTNGGDKGAHNKMETAPEQKALVDLIPS